MAREVIDIWLFVARVTVLVHFGTKVVSINPESPAQSLRRRDLLATDASEDTTSKAMR